MQAYLIVALVFAIAVAVFAVQNSGMVTIRFLNWQSDASLIFIILGSAVAGALAVGLVGLMKQLSLSIKLRNTTNRLHKLQEEYDRIAIENDELHYKLGETTLKTRPAIEQQTRDSRGDEGDSCRRRAERLERD
ncbi:MAG: LapA family protein [Firmicutes bacterium]|nr:LapA family protein [Bacillota bacterium]